MLLVDKGIQRVKARVLQLLSKLYPSIPYYMKPLLEGLQAKGSVFSCFCPNWTKHNSSTTKGCAAIDLK